MLHLVRAEYAAGTEDEPADEPGRAPVVRWHMVRAAKPDVAMCGRDLEHEAQTLSEAAWGATEELFCSTCGALYLREVP